MLRKQENFQKSYANVIPQQMLGFPPRKNLFCKSNLFGELEAIKNGSPMMHKDSKDAQAGKEQNDNEHDEAVARDAFLVSHGPQPLNASGGQVTH